MPFTERRSATVDEFMAAWEEAQQPSPFYEGPAPRGFNPRVIVARIELKTESADEAEAIGLEIAELIREARRDGRIDYAYQSWAYTSRTALEGT